MDGLITDHIELLNEQQVRNLLKISNIVNSNFDLTSMLQTIVDTISENSIWPIVGIVIIDEEKHEEWFAAQRGFKIYNSIEEDRWSLDICISPQAVRSGKAIVIEDFFQVDDLPPGVRDYCIESGYRSAVLVPLKETYPSTVLWLCTPDVTQHTQSDIVFAESLSNQVAIAYRNAQLYEKSRSQAAELAKIHDTMGQLLNMVVERDTSEKIRNAAAQMFKNPIWFEDHYGNRIPNIGGPSAPDKLETTLPIKYPYKDHNVLAIPIVSGSEQFGWLLSLDSHEDFKESDISFLRQLALIFSMVFLKERVFHEVESQVRMDLFSSLVSITEKDTQNSIKLNQRATALRVEIPQRGRVAIVGVDSGNSVIDFSFQDKLARAATTIARWLPNRLVAIQDQYIAMLISPGEENKIAKRLTELNFFFSTSQPILAVGEIVESKNLYGVSLTSALKVLNVVRYLNLKGMVFKSEDLGIYSILFDPGKQGELESFSRKVLGQLLSNDPQGIYWETLKTFFEENFHLESTAKILNIHISTLRYRLDKIQSFGIDWKKSDTRLEIHIAIVVEKWRR
ncbi:GAF domain-containing protein [Siminovitchia sediminis]|uniref:GAF domain-containing protein n=1 Tax=Siminovitchia sediminis TaxID=1274353 RepID=A0ABW4KNX4_9BACI